MMALPAGTRVGVYEVTGTLGAGGMGEVYRARDTKLNRDVALKVLPEMFAADPDRLARFQREAQLLASLNHPNIGSIYGLEDAGRPALVLELVEGPTLADRIAQGPMPLDEVLPIARQIAEALETAHEKGIVHRDLKPANIKLTPDGKVKVLDFGLAKLNDSHVANGPNDPNLLTISPTLLSPAATQVGVILGTAAYMSPEQAKGKLVDRRTDMWAFGCVLFEMLTGTRPFQGDDVTDFVVAVLSREPDWTELPPSTPRPLERLIRRCLVKDRRHRLPDAAAAGLDIEEAATAPAEPVAAAQTPARFRIAALAGAAALVAVAAAGAFLAGRASSSSPAPPAVRFEIAAPGGSALVPGFSTYAISPDGRQIVFEAVERGRRALWVRALASPAAALIPGTQGGRNAFWSPDGSSVGFFADGKLRRVDLAGGGGAFTLADALAAGATWGVRDVILYGGEVIHRVSASGGSPAAVTSLDKARGELAHTMPAFLPDGRGFVFLSVNQEPEKSAVVLASVDGGQQRILLTGTSNAAYADGHLLYARGAALMAHPFDVDKGVLTGEPVVLAESVREGGGGRAAFAAAGGTLAFDANRAFPEAEVATFSRDGRETGAFATKGPFHTMWPSPDLRRVVVESGSTDGGTDLWIVDADRGSRTRLTTGPATEGHPVWSPDGREIAFFEGIVGTKSRLAIAPATGVREPRVILDTATYKQVSDWSRDGRLLVFEEQNPTTGWDVGVVAADGSSPPALAIKSRFTERLGALSPDGRFLAYVSDESGRSEVYVVTFPDITDKWSISADGGTKPRWRRDGTELFFVTASGTLMRVAVQTGSGFKAGVPERLFDLDLIGSDGWDYAMSDDAQRFLALRYAGTNDGNFSVIANWTGVLRK